MEERKNRVFDVIYLSAAVITIILLSRYSAEAGKKERKVEASFAEVKAQLKEMIEISTMIEEYGELATEQYEEILDTLREIKEDYRDKVVTDRKNAKEVKKEVHEDIKLIYKDMKAGFDDWVKESRETLKAAEKLIKALRSK